MPSAAQHLAWGTHSLTHSLGAMVLITTTSEMLRCARHDRPLSLFRNKSIHYTAYCTGMILTHSIPYAPKLFGNSVSGYAELVELPPPLRQAQYDVLRYVGRYFEQP